MKATVLIFCTLFVITNIVIANNEISQPPLLDDMYQKKQLDHIMSGPKILNRRRITKQNIGLNKFENIRTKKHFEDNEYTVFPSHLKKEPIDVPSSPYFSGDPHNDEPKLRVKKVLPDFWNIHDRKKRSPEETTAVKKNDAKSAATKSEAVQDITTKGAEKVASEESKIARQGAEEVKKVDPKDPTKVKAADVKKAKAPVNGTHVSKPKQNTKKGKTSGTRTKKSKKPAAKGSKVSATNKAKPKNNATRSAKSSNTKKNATKLVKRSSANKKAKKGKVSVSRRLIAGRDALIENYPYVVSIQKDGEHWCAGALLNQRLVITTANCVWKSNRMSRMKIRAGSRHLEHGGQLVQIAEVLKHPRWSIRKNPDHDVALLLTDNFVKFSHSCHAVDLPNRVMMPVFDDAWVSSWGAERRDGVYIKQGLTLQVFHTRLFNREKCNNVTMRFGVMVTENFICLEQIGRRAPCTRDTGAPAVSDGVLWGLASWGIRKMCGTERFPAMFSYIASQNNMDFIINGTKYLMSEQRLSPFLDKYPVPRSQINNNASLARS